jgi:N-acetyltransferase 10
MQGLEALAFKEHADYEAVASTNPDFNHAIVSCPCVCAPGLRVTRANPLRCAASLAPLQVRVNIFRGHRQTVQYIEAHDAEKLAQAELVVIDEAAAIPLPLVKALLGPYLVFLASTVHGYEGTGRSLSLKLIQQLRQQAQVSEGA